MFESNDDCLDVDDGFLNEVYENESNNYDRNFLLDFENKQTLNKPYESQYSVRSIEQGSALAKPKTVPVLGSSVEESIPIRRQLNCTDQGNKEDHLRNKENKRKLSPSLMPIRTKRERKFPGPAGLLPDRKSRGFTPVKLDSLLDVDKSHSNPSEDLCSQGRCSGSILEEEPWQNFLADLGPDKSILDEVNVASVKRKAAAKCFVGRKVPFLAAVLHHLDVSSPDPCVILRDSTGEIHGTLHREVWELFAAELLVGSVLVIRNVGLLSTGISSRRHYLNITANNLVTIYSSNSDKQKNGWLQTQDFAQSIHNWRSLVSPAFGIGSPAAVGSPGLFNSTLCSPFSNSSISCPNTPTETNSNIHRKAEVNKSMEIKFQNTPQGSNLNNVKSNPGPSVRNTAVGKNLMHSFSPKSCNNPPKFISNNVSSSNNLSKNFPNQNQLKNNMSCDFNKQISNPFVCSNLVQPVVKPKLLQTTPAEDTVFKFDPVILEPKKFSCDSFPQSNAERQIRNRTSELITNSCLEDNKTELNTANNSKLVFSQSTQLTIEEQSLVESVFDGVDADSLFDDDF